MNKKRRFFLTSTILVMGVFVVTNISLAAVGLQVGNSSLNLGAAENLYYGNISASSATTSNLLLLQNAGVSKLRVDYYGNLTTPATITAGGFTGPLSGIITAANVSAGAFGSNTGGGNYSFPGNVGIGTTNPSGLLSLTKSLSLNDNQEMFSVSHDNSYNLKLYQNFSASGVMQYNWVQKVAGVDNNVLTFRQGNVGIGTTNPAYKLDVNGVSIFRDYALFSSVGRITWDTPGFIIRADSTNKLNLGGGGRNSDLVIDTIGNVGIGTMAPTAVLHVSAPAVASTQEAVARFGVSDTTNYLEIRNNTSADGKFNPAIYGLASDVSNYAVGFIGDVSGNDTGTVPAYNFQARAGAGATANRDVLSVSNYGTEYFRITRLGSVGIGTTNPGASLQVGDVNKVSEGIIRLEARNSGGGARSWDVGVSAQANAYNFRIKDSARTDPDFLIQWNTGNVGIGTVSPLTRFHVAGNVGGGGILHLTDSSVESSIAYKINGGTGNVGWVSGNYNNDFFMYSYSLATQVMTLKPTGNVGIGAAAPNDKFSIGLSGSAAPAGSDSTGHNYTSTYLSTDNYALANYGVVKSLIAIATSTMTAGTNFWGGTKNANIWNGDAGAGNVGIGTADPSGKLNVISTDYNTLNLSTSGVDSNTRLFGSASGSGGFVIAGGGGADFIAFRTGATSNSFNGTERVRITSGGNVGIGTTAPANKLSISETRSDDTPILAVNSLGDFSFLWASGSMAPNITAGHNFLHMIGKSASGKNSGYFGFNYQGAGSNSNFVSLGLYSADNILNVTGGGNVGIGTTGPTSKLDVRGHLNVSDSSFSNPGSWGSTIYLDNANHSRILINERSSGTQVSLWAHTGGNARVGATSNHNFHIITNGADRISILNTGNVGIATAGALDKFSIGMGGVAAPAGSDGTGHNNAQTYVGTDNYALANVGYVKSLMSGSYLPLAGGTMTGDVNFGGRNITNLNGLTVSKITATTIDPLYNIKGINYSTFAPSISGGVKEEYVGKASIRRYNQERGEYEYVVDFDLEKEGSDLWVWRQVVDYSDSSVQVIVTPSGKFAAVYYLVRGNQLVLRSDREVEVSYRLIANRYDWREWPTKAKDQSQTGVIIK